jgi:hypothetical protein
VVSVRVVLELVFVVGRAEIPILDLLLTTACCSLRCSFTLYTQLGISTYASLLSFYDV